MILPFNPLLICWHKQCRNAIRLLCTHGLPPLSLKLVGTWPCTFIIAVSGFLFLCRNFKENLTFLPCWDPWHIPLPPCAVLESYCCRKSFTWPYLRTADKPQREVIFPSHHSLKPVVIPLRTVDPRQSITNVVFSRLTLWQQHQLRHCCTPPRSLLPVSVLNFRYSAPSFPIPSSGGFTTKKCLYPDTIAKGAENQVPVFPMTLFLQASPPYCHVSLSLMHTDTEKKTQKPKENTDWCNSRVVK